MNYLTEQLKLLGKGQSDLAEFTGIPKTTINSYCRGRAEIPERHWPKFEEFGIPRPQVAAAQDANALAISIVAHLGAPMDLRVENIKGYMEAQFRGAHDEREALAEILRALAERVEDIAGRVGLESLKSARVSKKTG